MTAGPCHWAGRLVGAGRTALGRPSDFPAPRRERSDRGVEGVEGRSWLRRRRNLSRPAPAEWAAPGGRFASNVPRGVSRSPPTRLRLSCRVGRRPRRGSSEGAPGVSRLGARPARGRRRRGGPGKGVPRQDVPDPRVASRGTMDVLPPPPPPAPRTETMGQPGGQLWLVGTDGHSDTGDVGVRRPPAQRGCGISAQAFALSSGWKEGGCGGYSG